MAAMLASCELVPKVDTNSKVGCHTKHINCQRFDYQSFSHFTNSLDDHFKRWKMNPSAGSMQQLNAIFKEKSPDQFKSLEDFIEAVEKHPGDIYPLIKKAQEEGYGAYDRFLIEQAFLRSITTPFKLLNQI